MVKHKPKKNVEYTFVIPETGRIITIRFLDVSEKNRLIFLNLENNNTLDFHPSRFSFLYEKCKVKEKKCEEPEQPRYEAPAPVVLDEPEMTKEEEKEIIGGMVKKLRTLPHKEIGKIISATGKHPYRLADEIEKYYNSDINDDVLFARINGEYHRVLDVINPVNFSMRI